MFRFLAVPAACLALAGPAAAQGARYVSLPPEPIPVLRGGEPPVSGPAASNGAETAAALKAPAPAVKPWCPAERRVGTGAGFCLVN